MEAVSLESSESALLSLPLSFPLPLVRPLLPVKLVREPSDSPRFREEIGLPRSREGIVSSERGQVLIFVSWVVDVVLSRGAVMPPGGEDGSTIEGGGEGYAEEGVFLTEWLPLAMADVRALSVESQAFNLASSGLIHQRSAGLVFLVPL